MADSLQQELARVYANRFDAKQDYRKRVWEVLTRNFFQQFIPESAAVLDLGCGYGEFINAIKAREKFGMDLNPRSREHVGPAVQLLEQDCSTRWPLPDGHLDVVFTSNFLEHLPERTALARTVEEASRCLKPGGRFVAMGPNIKFARGAYWDFWDHHIALTEVSLSEGLSSLGFTIERCEPRFLPYTMAKGPRYPLWMLKAYLQFPLLWRLRGKQFLVVARKS
jgi:SAM-dependent methyltransferase